MVHLKKLVDVFIYTPVSPELALVRFMLCHRFTFEQVSIILPNS